MGADRAELLAGQLSSAHGAASAIAGRAPIGLRAIEPAAGRRWYLCAFDGPSFLCLTASLDAEGSERRAREAAALGLLWEHAEAAIDAEALRGLAQAAGRSLAGAHGPAEVDAALGALAEEALRLAAWRAEPERALASLPELERGLRLHEAVRAAYGRFVAATDPLAAAQEVLPRDQVAGLREVEEAAGRAGLAESVAQRLAAAVPDCDEGAGQVVEGHLTRLE
jgi:hypothetical protein